jgi:predicted metalloprotease with PDZ domain
MPSDAKQGIHAEAKLNAFVIFFPPLTSENEGEWNSLTWVLTHEHFHIWNPFKMLPTLTENFDSLAWFTEGFTEYYTAVLSYRIQTLDLDSCINEINNFLYSYYTSPFRNVTNDRFQEERWKDIQMQVLAYQRGCLLALLWDSKIREKTTGKYSLDDVMHDLLQRVKKQTIQF